MAELEKLVKAKVYCDKLANGIDPITDRVMVSDVTLNQVQMVRFFSFLKEYLREEIQQKSTTLPQSSKSQNFLITRKGLSDVEISSRAVSSTVFSRRITEKTEAYSKMFSYKWIHEWLLAAGFLELSTENGMKIPTKAGLDIGIVHEWRPGKNQQYYAILFNKSAQQFLIDNMDSILGTQGYSILP
jgi:hypothetical protein